MLGVEIVLKQSAFKHGIGEADILNATTNFIYDGSMDNDDYRRLLVGFDTKGNLIEVMYEVINEDRVNVFHVMKARKALIAAVIGR